MEEEKTLVIEPGIGLGGWIGMESGDLSVHFLGKMEISNSGGAESTSTDEDEQSVTGAENAQIRNHRGGEYLDRSLSILKPIVIDNGEHHVMENKDVNMVGGEAIEKI